MMRDDFFRFPSTSHLALLGDVDVRGDKVMSELERDAFLGPELVVEEKVDGANLGISFDSDANIRAQNRGTYLSITSEGGQWSRLQEWLHPNENILFDHLTNRYILFGEWCYAQHSVFYDQLPDWFLGLDVYDKQVGCFLSSNQRDDLFNKIGIIQVPSIARGNFTFQELTEILSPPRSEPLRSKLGHQQAEGLYLRSNQGDWLGQRAKLVQPAFLQSIEEHWSRKPITPNQLASEV